MTSISLKWKKRLAWLVRFRTMQRLMSLGIYLTVPRQRIGVAVVSFNDAGQVLMLRHVFHPQTPWGLPGGWLKRNESPEDGALRELKEETGLSGIIEDLVQVSFDDHHPHIGIAYRVKLNPGIISLSPEILEARWFSVEALPNPIVSFVRDAIHQASTSQNPIRYSVNREFIQSL